MRNHKIDEDPDFIVSKKYKNSLRRFLAENPIGASDAAICRMLEIAPDELESVYLLAIQKLRSTLTA